MLLIRFIFNMFKINFWTWLSLSSVSFCFLYWLFLGSIGLFKVYANNALFASFSLINCVYWWLCFLVIFLFRITFTWKLLTNVYINNHNFCYFVLLSRLRIIIIADGFSLFSAAAGFKFLYVEKSARSLLYWFILIVIKLMFSFYIGWL